MMETDPSFPEEAMYPLTWVKYNINLLTYDINWLCSSSCSGYEN